MTETELTRQDILERERIQRDVQRTLLSWTRLSMAMIAFGFTIYTVLRAIQEQSRLPVLLPQAPRNLGLALIGIGTFALAIASLQYWIYIRRLRSDKPGEAWDLTFFVAALVALLGLLILGGILLRIGGFV